MRPSAAKRSVLPLRAKNLRAKNLHAKNLRAKNSTAGEVSSRMRTPSIKVRIRGRRKLPPRAVANVITQSPTTPQ